MDMDWFGVLLDLRNDLIDLRNCHTFCTGSIDPVNNGLENLLNL
jgi:hypothetical protein